MIKKLYWMKNSSKTQLHLNFSENLPLYINGEFEELKDSDWQQKEIMEYDDSLLSQLSGNPSDDLKDSLIIFNTFKDLPPILAFYLNVWIPLIHIDLLEYTRTRWFKEKTGDELKQAISIHVFQGGRNGIRDDNSVGRLWWSGYIGSRMAGSTDLKAIEEMLAPLMQKTDIRANAFERPGIFSESYLAGSISRYMKEGKLPNHTDTDVYREFFKNLSFKSNGRYFGDMSPNEMDKFLKSCHT